MNNSKYTLKGLGIGFVIASLIVTIYQPRRELSDQEIINKARELGMKTQKDFLEVYKDDDQAVISKARQLGMVFADEIKNEEDKSNDQAKIVTPTGETVEIVIESGMLSMDVSNLLYQEALIEDVEVFNQYMNEHNLTKRIDIGSFAIKRGSSYKEIAEIITR